MANCHAGEQSRRRRWTRRDGGASESRREREQREQKSDAAQTPAQLKTVWHQTSAREAELDQA